MREFLSKLFFTCIVFSIEIVLFSSSAWAAEFYISPGGSDDNPGTYDQPLKSLDAARLILRKADNNWNGGDIVFWIRKGIYFFEKPFKLTSDDLKSVSGRKVVFSGYKNDEAVLSGCSPALIWNLYDKKKKIYSAEAPGFSGINLFSKGRHLYRAREPNLENGEIFGGYLFSDFNGKDRFFVQAGSAVKNRVAAASGGRVELVVNSHWYHQRFPVLSVTKEDEGIDTQILPRVEMFKRSNEFYIRSASYFVNSFEFLDSPGEWFFDAEKKALFLVPYEGMDLNSVRYPRVDKLIEISGKVGDPIENVEFSNLTMECSSWAYEQRAGVTFGQMGQSLGYSRSVSRGYVSGLISIENARGIVLKNNLIRDVGGEAVQFISNVDDSRIVGNKISYVAGDGLEIDIHGRRNPTSDFQSSGVVVSDNEFSFCGIEYTSAGAILVHNVSNILIEHNWIHDMPYSGMQVCDDPGGRSQNVGCSGAMIRFNRVNDVLKVHDDGGAIYLLGGVHNNSLVEGNFVYGVKKSRWAGSFDVDAIYLDNFTSGVLVRNNVLRGGRVAERNGAVNNILTGNVKENHVVESNAGPRSAFLH